jgi:uncharacterized membrane protein YczE
MGKKLVFYLMGIAIACMGVTFLLKSNAGAGPQDVVLLELSEKTGLTFGTWVIISQAVFLLFNSFLLKKRPQFESVITMIIWGVIVDFWMEIIFKDLSLFLYTPLLEWICFLTGALLIGIGVGIYLTANLPAMPYDGLMVGLCEKFRINLMMSRTILSFIILLILNGQLTNKKLSNISESLLLTYGYCIGAFDVDGTKLFINVSISC